MTDKRHYFDLEPKESGPVECLGMTFESDKARRAHFVDRLRERLQDPEFRKIPGFPQGSDEDILRLSDPPYYTACPNPFVSLLVAPSRDSQDSVLEYNRTPFASDVSEGKNDPVYNAHSYHTKVPHKAIMRLLLHYTDPNDVVLDAFCGSGMTGVAAQLCGDIAEIRDLGLDVRRDGTVTNEQGEMQGMVGHRRAILADLSPAASFIARNYNRTGDRVSFSVAAKEILAELRSSWGWMYRTRHVGWSSDQRVHVPDVNPGSPTERMGTINYVIWSDVLLCTNCGEQIVYWRAAARPDQATVADEFRCPVCNTENSKGNCERAKQQKYDHLTDSVRLTVMQVPVLIDYTFDGKRYHKHPDAEDLELVQRIEDTPIPFWVPRNEVPDGFNLDQPKRSHGVAYAYDFYSRRNLIVLAALWRQLGERGFPPLLSMWFTSTHAWATRLNRLLVSNFFLKRGGVIGQTLSGTLYISSVGVETNVLERLELRVSSVPFGANADRALVACGSATDLGTVPADSIDYIFTDPPFGANIMYSDLNFLWESWLKVFTDSTPEAIVNPAQGKGFEEYVRLMKDAFGEMYRVLKPMRWITVEFHNSRNSIWNGIQQALREAGFIIADVRILEKTHHSFKQVTSANAVKKDLVISAYKPASAMDRSPDPAEGSPNRVWEFVRSHLHQLPIFTVTQEGKAGLILERTNYMLFDRLVAYHLQRGYQLPLSASEFYEELGRRLPVRDGMYFLPEQVITYDQERARHPELVQLSIMVSDEASAIQWIRLALKEKPRPFHELQPDFLREMGGWFKHESPLELRQLLEENFLVYDGTGPVPAQIHTYLSTNFRDMRGLPKDDPILKAKATDRWFVPDPSKQGDLDQLRNKRLLKEFQGYKESKQRRLKQFRTEAIRVGFRAAYDQKDYRTIIAVAKKLPEQVIQEDEKLLMYYDVAAMRLGED